MANDDLSEWPASPKGAEDPCYAQRWQGVELGQLRREILARWARGTRT
jgi:hypothetical protein